MTSILPHENAQLWRYPAHFLNDVVTPPPLSSVPLKPRPLPTPLSRYINTPVPMPSEIEMTHTEHVAPPTMDEALNKVR